MMRVCDGSRRAVWRIVVQLSIAVLAISSTALLTACDGAAESEERSTPTTTAIIATATAAPEATRLSGDPPGADPTAGPSDGADLPPPEPTGTLSIFYFDVGQGDATLLHGPDFAILIDAGRHDRNDVVQHLRSVGLQSLDILIGTHPHADHIGQIPQVLEAFPVREVWLSGDTHTTQTFERVIDAIEASDAGYHEPRSGETYTIGSAILEVVHPASLTGTFHDGSISVKVTYGQVAFLFTGDAEMNTERDMIVRGHDLRAHVLQLGHHGSRTSSSQLFLNAVGPEVGIYSAGLNNQYGHPHPEVIDRLQAMGVDVYGTAEHGTIVVVTDGVTYEVQTQVASGPRGPPVADAQPTPVPAAPTQPPVAPTTAPGAPPPAPTGCVDINTASIDELQQIIHIGPARAQEMLQLRPFRSVDDMTRINGIAAGRLADIKAQGLACVG